MSDLGNKEIFAENLTYYMNKNNVTRHKLCDDLCLKYSTVRDWLKAITYPRIDKIEMLANYFKISKSDLVEEMIEYVDNEIIDNHYISEEDQLLLDAFHAADPIDRYAVLRILGIKGDEILENAQ